MKSRLIRIVPAGSFNGLVVRRFFEDCVLECPYMSGILSHNEWPQKLAENADCICVQNCDGRLQGALFCYCNDVVSKVSHIPFFAVLAECRNVASGQKLHSAYTSYVQVRGMEVSQLEVDGFNVRAKRFYENLGYSQVAVRGGKILLRLVLPDRAV